MADKNVLEIVLEALDKSMTATVNSASGAIDSLDKSVQANKETFDAFKKTGAAFTAAAAAGAATIYTLVGAFQEQERAETKLEQITRQTTGATDAQIQSLKDQASALQEVGVIGDEVTLAGQAQLATFGLTTEAIAELSPGLLDLVANQKGVNASQEDAMTIANLLGKVMEGQVGALSRYGVSLTDAQAELLKTGTEMEKTAVLAEVLGQNVGGVNEALADTAEGAIKQAKNAFGDLKETLGEALAPTIVQIADGIKSLSERFQTMSPQTKDLIAKVLLFGTAFAGIAGPLMIAIGMIPMVTKGFVALKLVMTTLTGPIGLIILAVGALVAAWTTNFLGIRDVTKTVIEFIKTKIDAGLAFIEDRFGGVLGRISGFWEEHGNTIIETARVVMDFLTDVFLMTWENLRDSIVLVFSIIEAAVKVGVDLIAGSLDVLISLLDGDFQGAWEAAGRTVENISGDMTLFFSDAAKSIALDVANIISAMNKIPVIGGFAPQALVDTAIQGLESNASNGSIVPTNEVGAGRTTNNNVSVNVSVQGDMQPMDENALTAKISDAFSRQVQLQSLGSA